MSIKIFIDQGHNPQGPNTGAQGNGIKEQDITFKVGKVLFDLLNENPKFSAKLSREYNYTILGTNNISSLKSRVSMANTWEADYFISIHCNGSTNPEGNGTEAYVYKRDTQAYYLGQNIVDSVCLRMNTANRGVYSRPGLYVLRKTLMPAVLVELAFVSNKKDAYKLENDSYGFAYGMYSGILRYFGM